MNLVKMKAGDNCLIVSLAMVLDREPCQILKDLAVDPNEVIFKDGGRRGIHVQEVIDLVMPKGITIIENRFGFTDPNNQDDVVEISCSRSRARFLKYLCAREGILNGISHSGVWHSCAWDGFKVFDPKGRITDLESAFAEVLDFWIFV